jgi:hypothetical protein
MAATQDITQGIKFIKINKTDLEGNDNTLSLQGLETLRLKLNDLGVVEFKVISISEAVDYYTLFVEPNDIFESKVIGSFLNLNSTVESTPVSGIFTLTPGAAVTFDGYAIGSTTESSIDPITGQIAPFYPATCIVQVDYIVSQSSDTDQNPLIPYISGSFGKIFENEINLEGINTFETHSRYFTITPELKSIPTTNNKDLAIKTFTPAISSSNLNSNTYALSTTTKVFISQSEFVIDNNIIPDATLDTKDDTTRTLAEGVTRIISTWDVGQYYNFPGVNTLGPLSVTCSFDAATDGSGGIGGNGILKIDLVSSERGIIATTSSLQGSSFPPLSYLPTTLSQSFYPVNQNEQFYIQVSNTATGVDNISYRSGSWEINQGVTAQSLETLNVFSPFITEGNFSISDCNPLINNAITDRVNEFYMDVDYSSNAIIAVNADTILSGSATRANVQYSNYTTARVIRPRYEGSKNTSPDLNELNGSQLPAIEQTTAFFLYNRGGNFNQVSDRSGSAHYNIGFLIDDLGNTYEPQESESAYLPNLLSGFGRDSKVTFVATDTGSEAAGTFNVHYPAVKIKPVLYSDTGSLGNDFLISGTIAGGNLSIYQNPQSFVDFNSEVGLTSNQDVLINQTDDILLTNITSDQEGGWGYNSSGDWSYTVQESSNVSGRVQAQVVAAVLNVISPGATNNDLQLQLYRNGVLIATDSETSVPPGSIRTFNIYKTLRFTKGDEYVLKFNNSGDASTANTVRLAPTSGFDNTLVTTAAELPNFPDPGSIISVPYTNSFSTGTTISSVLTASQDIAKWYGGAYTQGNNIPGYSFNVPFVFEQYDEVRWNGTEETVSLIDHVEWSNTPSISGDQYEMYIYLTAPIDTSIIDLDYYEFRRNVFQKDSIIVNTPGPIIEKGFILPEYQTPRLKANLSNIIQDLTDKGLV